MNVSLKILVLCFFISFGKLIAECSDLDSLQCNEYPEWCEWNENFDFCQELECYPNLQ